MSEQDLQELIAEALAAHDCEKLGTDVPDKDHPFWEIWRASAGAALGAIEKHHHCASCDMHSCGDLARPAPLFPADSRDLDMTAPKACAWCQVEFVDGDKIIPVPTLGAEGWHVIGWHPECELRSRAGSPAHLRGTCAVVCGGDGSEADSGPQTPEEMRAEALESWRMVKGS